MNTTVKKIVVALTFVVTACSLWAWPGPPPPPPHHHHHHGGDGWAAVGIGLAAGAVGAAIYNSVAPRETVVVQQPVVTPAPVVVQQPAPVVVQQPAPVVVQQPAPVVVQQPAPVVVRQQVWVEGRYVQQVQANGTVVNVWQPGHYE